MTEVFSKYPETTPVEERKGSPVCVVSHPDAGGPCGRPAVGEVWSLSFCEPHGREAELAAVEELEASLEGLFEGLVAVEQERHDRNETAVKILREAASRGFTRSGPGEPGEAFDSLAHGAAMIAAYLPEELAANTDPDTLAYDYEGEASEAEDCPNDWWSESQMMVCRFMRQAHDRGLIGLLKDLEYVRERATVQMALAERDLRLRWTEPRAKSRDLSRGT